MKLSNSISIALFSITLLLFSCEKETTNSTASETFECKIENTSPKGNRMIGLDLLNTTEANLFDNNVAFAKELGIEFIALHVNWKDMEPTTGNFTDPFDAINLLGQVAAANNMKFSLTLRPIDLVGKSVPHDLENIRFSDVQMINRFKALVDFIFTKVDPNILLNLQIGNEIDGMNTSNEHEEFWNDYGIFLNSITEYIHTSHPNLKIGFTGTLPGLLENPNRFKILLENVDILGVTYYPLKSNFDVKDPSVVFEDFNNLTNEFQNPTIYLQEVGYQSSSTNNSSPSKQAEFFCNFFQAWDIHKDQIKTANIVRLNDLSEAEAKTSAGPYGISNTEFIEYLRTLGIRTFDGEGENKEAFEVIKNNLRERGW